MLLWRFAVRIFSASAIVLTASVACGQGYPSKPIRIVTAEPGGGSDFAARLIAQGLTGSLGQQVVVDNRGGSVVIAAGIVAKAPPDGYTVLLYSGTFWMVPLLQKVPYDPVKDFAPITLAVSSPVILVVNPSVAAGSVKELIALAKAGPGELNYGSAGPGSPAQMAAELFKAMAGINIVAVPYKGGGPAITALIGVQVQLMFPSAGSVISHVKSGRLRALAVTSAQPSALLPGLPTVAASGLPDYETATLFGMFAPAATPAALINQLNHEIVRVLNRAEVKERLFNANVEVVGNSPKQFAVAMKSEMTKWSKVIKDAGIRAE